MSRYSRRLAECFNIDDLREAARRRLPKGLFEFVDRGTEDDETLHANRRALERLHIVPRFLIDVSRRSQRTILFGTEQSSPIVVAPTGATSLLWHNGELHLARAAAAAGIPYILSTASITPMELIAEHCGGQQWFQLYMWPDREMSNELVDRARNLGFKVLVVTVDNVVAPNREYNRRNRITVPLSISRRTAWEAIKHPDWTLTVVARYLATTGMPQFSNLPAKMQSSIRGQGVNFPRPDRLTWEDLSALRARWPHPLVVKGLLDPRDALEAVNCGVDGIVVSNHGGRSLDTAVASLDALAPIADAVGDRTTLLVDGGIRRGSDVAKAIGLGAKAVLLGRLPLWGVAAGGEAGATHAFSLLMSELDRVMGLAGCNTPDEFRDRIQPANWT